MANNSDVYLKRLQKHKIIHERNYDIFTCLNSTIWNNIAFIGLNQN